VVIPLACELPASRGVALSRWSSSEPREAASRGIAQRSPGVTIWRWLTEAAISLGRTARGSCRATRASPPRAGPILNLYAGRWHGERLRLGDYVVCADEKRRSKRASGSPRPVPPGPAKARARREYERTGALCTSPPGRQAREDLQPLRT
jgi:hypothetical protein